MFARTAILFLMTGMLAAGATGLAQGTKPYDKPATARFGDPSDIARAYQSYLSGIIKKIGKDELVLEKTRFGVDTTVKLLPKTKYIRDKKAGKFDQLEVGEQVFVDVKTEKKTGEMSAKKVLSGILPGS
jgi:hypothetical protein